MLAFSLIWYALSMASKNESALFIKTKKALTELQKNIPRLSDGERATLEVLLDKEALAGLKESMDDVKHGRTFTLDEVKKQLG